MRTTGDIRAVLSEAYEALKEELSTFCSSLGVPDLSSLRFDTIAVSETEIRKVVNGKVYRYPRVQLKGEIRVNRMPKTKTIASWKKDEAPYGSLHRLVSLYRGTKHLSKALDYLYFVV